LSRYWVTAAWAAVRTQGSYLRAQSLRLKARRGAKKAILAVAASMFGACYYMLRDAVPYRDLGALSLQPPRQAEDSRSPHPTLRTCPFVALPSEADPAMCFGVSSSTSKRAGRPSTGAKCQAGIRTADYYYQRRHEPAKARKRPRRAIGTRRRLRRLHA
jgi:hypothetical protein